MAKKLWELMLEGAQLRPRAVTMLFDKNTDPNPESIPFTSCALGAIYEAPLVYHPSIQRKVFPMPVNVTRTG